MNREMHNRIALAMTVVALVAAPGLGQDFNGDGVADIAIGAPGERVAGAAGAGAVTIIYGAGPGLGLDAFAVLPAAQLTQATFGLEIPEVDDGFGSALAWGDFDADGFDDLAVGSPGEDLPTGTVDSGLVLVYYGSPGGLIPMYPPYLSQGPGGLPDPDEPGDHLGWSLAAGDFDADGFTDLAIGVPGEDVLWADQGLVHQCMGGPTGLMPVGAPIPMFLQSMLGDPDEAHDQFGMALAAGDLDGVPGDDLAIGVPLESYSGDSGCGMVHVVYSTPGFGLDPTASTPPQVWTQDSPGVPNVTQADDHFGWSLAIGDFDGSGVGDLAIGVPQESISADFQCGIVQVIYSAGPGVGLDVFTPVATEVWHQDKPGIPEQRQPHDWFGYSLAGADFNGDGIDDLAIGVPNENVGSISDAGYVNVIYGAGTGFGLEAAGPVIAEAWHQNRPGVANANQASDRFGWALTAGDYDGNGCADLAVGAPFEDLGTVANCGIVVTIYGSIGSVGLDGSGPVMSEPWHQNIAGIPDSNEPGDGFGRALDSGE